MAGQKGPEQCRTHHQKYLLKYETIDKIIKELTVSQSKTLVKAIENDEK